MNRILVTLGVVLGAALAARAAESTKIDIKPGPSEMSAAERAIQPDPASGAEHGVILVEETNRNDDLPGTGHIVGYHLRAKILSPEGRGLGDIEIPVESEYDLKNWWAKTILPDGKVIDLPQSELKTQSEHESRWGRSKVLKAALPGVVPGCVIDYGYSVRGEGVFRVVRYYMQKDWPIRQLRYRWAPAHTLGAAYVTSHIEGKDVKVSRDGGSVLVTANNMTPVPDEPHMPPKDEVQAMAVFYYTTSDEPDHYWDEQAKQTETVMKRFLGNGDAVRNLIEAMKLDPSAPLPAKLQDAYGWIGKNIKNTNLQTAEEAEEGDSDDAENNIRSVLVRKQGTGRQLDYLFGGVARALGAEAYMVYAVDRTEHFWNKNLKSLDQFDFGFIGVRTAANQNMIYVDAGSGLPYGQVPWEATGATGLLCMPKGSGPALIPPTAAAKNRADTKVTVAFGDEGEMTAKWARTANGATGMDQRRWLRRLDPQDRKKRLEEICRGAGGSYEVEAAELPQLDDEEAPLQIACDLSSAESGLDEGTDRYAFAVTGPWWPALPEFPAASRTHAVILDYPKIDVLGIDVTSPPGFAPKDAPPAVTIESPFGRYQLLAVKTDKGFHVDRAFALLPLMVKTEQYAELKKFVDAAGNADRTTLQFERAKGKP